MWVPRAKWILLGALVLAGCDAPEAVPEREVDAEDAEESPPPPAVRGDDDDRDGLPDDDQPDDDQPQAVSPDDPDWTGPCVGPNYRLREPVAATPEACDPHSTGEWLAFYSGDAAVDQLRRCVAEGDALRDPYLALLVPREDVRRVVSGEVAEIDYLLSAPDGPRLVIHQVAEDGVTPCRERPVLEVTLGGAEIEAFERLSGLASLQLGPEGPVVGASLNYQHSLSPTGAAIPVASVSTHGRFVPLAPVGE